MQNLKLSADDILIDFVLFSLKRGFDSSCKLSPKDANCLLFSGKNMKNVSKCHLLNFLPSMLSI